jgi:chitodextrinase
VLDLATPPVPDTTAPTAPAGLSAIAASSAQINLAWTASTDNVAVTGYLVERCQGAGCSTFVQIATPTATSLNNTGLSSGTSYSYRVRATDAAGNLSAYSSVASSATTSSTPLGLVAAYSFSEGAGTTVADVSGNNNTGTASGTTWTTAGQFGSALVFNGTSAFVDLGNPATLRLTGSMTISAWVRSAAFPGDDAAIVSKRDGASLGYQLDTSIDTGPRTIGFKLTSSTGANMARYGATAMQLNQWYYVTGVYDAAAQTLNVYLNGVLDNGTLRGPVSATQQNSPLNVSIGRRTGLAGYAFNGTIDELRIYNRALTQAEIQADMAGPVR